MRTSVWKQSLNPNTDRKDIAFWGIIAVYKRSATPVRLVGAGREPSLTCSVALLARTALAGRARAKASAPDRGNNMTARPAENPNENPKLELGNTVILGLGFLGITTVWTVYNVYVSIFLQAGRPDYAQGVGVTGYGLAPDITGVILALDNLVAIIVLPFIGMWSDRTCTRWGRRKPFIVLGLPGAVLGIIAIPLVLGGPFYVFMVALLVTLTSMDILRTPTIALTPDMTSERDLARANGIINLMGCVGAILATVVAGHLFRISYLGPFLLGAVVMMIAFGLLLWRIREPETSPVFSRPGTSTVSETSDAYFFQNLRTLCGTEARDLPHYLAAIFFCYFAFSALEAFFSSYVVNKFGVDAGKAGMLLGLAVVTIAILAYPSGLLGDRWGRARTVTLGILGLSLVLAAALFVQTQTQFHVILVLTGASWTLIVVNSLPMIIDKAPVNQNGTYTGFYYFAMQSASVVGPALSGGVIRICGNNYAVVFPIAVVALVMALSSMLRARRINSTRIKSTRNDSG